MVMLQSEQQGGESSKDPYDEVMGKDKHKGYLRLHGSGVTKSKVQRKGKKPSYTLPEDFLDNMKANWTREVAQDVASLVLSQIKAANPDISIVIPDFGGTPRDESNDQNGEQDGRISSKTTSEHQGSNVHEESDLRDE
ncbi:hypothetical protein SOVF_172430 [Spinacia oleracea]|nr:uncharacterized protein LOC110796956 isoform X1 [Spinacia oleracea]XP_056683984.1 uncharacterized protein LOC110796956 isoform X1 [Spinacia oleracea]KNA07376.1 hypothetical protein SOVF_172430 [Spinacia oleracea]